MNSEDIKGDSTSDFVACDLPAPLYAKSFGFSLAAEVLQSNLYHQLNDKARAECDELLARGQSKGGQS